MQQQYVSRKVARTLLEAANALDEIKMPSYNTEGILQDVLNLLRYDGWHVEEVVRDTTRTFVLVENKTIGR